MSEHVDIVFKTDHVDRQILNDLDKIDALVIGCEQHGEEDSQEDVEEDQS